MRNLKKILALVLALVMSLSLMATASAAEASTAGDDPYVIAEEVLKGLSVYKGDYGTQDYRFDSEITRAEAAALVYRVATSDVEDKQAAVYTNNPFQDLAPVEWANGYISYGYNAEILKGTNAEGTAFEPTKSVTGHEILAMILRTLGYGRNHEFEGVNWELQTAATAKQQGLLEGITAADEARLGQPAPRKLVAQILFNALLQPTVKFSALNPYNYTKDAETLGYQRFKLEEVHGVVMANEYADLEGSETLDADETRFADLDSGESYTVTNQATGLDDIGESRLVYIQNGTKVLWMSDRDGAVRDGVKLNSIGETDVYAEDLKALKKDANATGDGEHFINFDRAGNRISDYKIKYVLRNDANLENPNPNLLGGLTPIQVKDRINDAAGDKRAELDRTGTTVTVIISPKTNITVVDLEYIRAIFGWADRQNAVANAYINGEVYVGSQSVTDISDVTNDNFKYSYDRFVDEFIYTSDSTFVTGNENGNYVKVIDNDADGKVDYVLKTVYTFAQVSRVKDDAPILDVTDHILKVTRDVSSGIKEDAHCNATTDGMNNLTTQPVVTEDTLVTGDIVYYALIDGKAQTYKADMVTATIEKVDHNSWVTTTTDGETYPASGVHEHVEDVAYSSDKTDLAGKASYDLYLDRSGNLGVFVKSDAVGEFKLITDGWYHRLKDSREYAVKVYNKETTAQDTVDITENGGLFIDNIGSGNDWEHLKYFGGNPTGVAGALNGDGGVGDKVRTTVAAITEGGTILPVENSSVTGRYQRNILDLYSGAGDAKVPTTEAVKGTVYFTENGSETAYNAKALTYDVRALDTTDYYVVYPNAKGDGVEVLYTKGYANAPKMDTYNKDKLVEDVYAVATRHEAENSLGTRSYYIASVVVVELNKAPSGTGSLVFVVDDTARYSDVRYRDVKLIGSDGVAKTVKVDWLNKSQILSDYADGADQGKLVQPGFYYLHNIGDETYRLSNSSSDAYAKTDRLDAKQIATVGGITLGRVEKSTWTQENKYVVVTEYTYGTDAAGNRNPDWTAKDGVPYTLPEDTKLYTLAYNEGVNEADDWTRSNPDLLQPGHEIVLRNRVDETPDRTLVRDIRPEDVKQNETGYNWNDVLIVHSKNAASYVVSFDNIYTDGKIRGVDYEDDYAQQLWRDLIPVVVDKAKDPVVFGTFYGVEFGLKFDANGTPSQFIKDKTKTADEHTMEYLEAKAWADKNPTALDGLQLKYNDGSVVKSTAKLPVPEEGIGLVEVTFKYTHTDKAGNKITKDYTFKLSVDPAKNLNLNLLADGVVLADVNEEDGTFTFVKTDGVYPRLSAVKEAILAKNNHLAKIDFTFFEAPKGNVIPTDVHSSFHLDNISNALITVTNDVGDQAHYWLTAPTGTNKFVVVETDDGLTLPDVENPKVNVEEIEYDAEEDAYTVKVSVKDETEPVVVVGDKVYKMTKQEPAQTNAVRAAEPTIWVCVLSAGEVGDVVVIYVRAMAGGEKDSAKLPESAQGDTAKARKDLNDKITEANTTLAALKNMKPVTPQITDMITKLEAAIKEAEAVAKDEDAAVKELEDATKDLTPVVADAKKITGELKTYAVTVNYDKSIVVKQETNPKGIDLSAIPEGNEVKITFTIENAEATYESVSYKVDSEDEKPVDLGTGKFEVTVTKATTIEIKAEPKAATENCVMTIEVGENVKSVTYSYTGADGKTVEETIEATKEITVPQSTEVTFTAEAKDGFTMAEDTPKEATAVGATMTVSFKTAGEATEEKVNLTLNYNTVAGNGASNQLVDVKVNDMDAANANPVEVEAGKEVTVTAKAGTAAKAYIIAEGKDTAMTIYPFTKGADDVWTVKLPVGTEAVAYDLYTVADGLIIKNGWNTTELPTAPTRSSIKTSLVEKTAWFGGVLGNAPATNREAVSEIGKYMFVVNDGKVYDVTVTGGTDANSGKAIDASNRLKFYNGSSNSTIGTLTATVDGAPFELNFEDTATLKIVTLNGKQVAEGKAGELVTVSGMVGNYYTIKDGGSDAKIKDDKTLDTTAVNPVQQELTGDSISFKIGSNDVSVVDGYYKFTENAKAATYKKATDTITIATAAGANGSWFTVQDKDGKYIDLTGAAAEALPTENYKDTTTPTSITFTMPKFDITVKTGLFKVTLKGNTLPTGWCDGMAAVPTADQAKAGVYLDGNAVLVKEDMSAKDYKVLVVTSGGTPALLDGNKSSGVKLSTYHDDCTIEVGKFEKLSYKVNSTADAKDVYSGSDGMFDLAALKLTTDTYVTIKGASNYWSIVSGVLTEGDATPAYVAVKDLLELDETNNKKLKDLNIVANYVKLKLDYGTIATSDLTKIEVTIGDGSGESLQVIDGEDRYAQINDTIVVAPASNATVRFNCNGTDVSAPLLTGYENNKTVVVWDTSYTTITIAPVSDKPATPAQ